MRSAFSLQNVLVGVSAILLASTRFTPHPEGSGPVLTAAVAFVTAKPAASTEGGDATRSEVSSVTMAALDAFSSAVRPLSRPQALKNAFRSYFAYKTAHPDEIQKPYLYFVDYGLPATTPRGYLFDMEALRVVDGPFTVAHGRGSKANRDGIPTRFSNASGSNATSLGLYVAKTAYDFYGKSGGRPYRSVGLRLMGVSEGFNDNAFARHVVAHGAPYVTPSKAGRSEGCPAMEPDRAERLLPKLANGGMVFLFAPDEHWLARDPWLPADAS